MKKKGERVKMEVIEMWVIKRKGNIEEFDMEKIETSIVNSAQDASSELTQGDVKVLLAQVKKRLEGLTKDNRTTSTYEIRGLVYHVLKDLGFTKALKSYMGLK